MHRGDRDRDEAVEFSALGANWELRATESHRATSYCSSKTTGLKGHVDIPSYETPSRKREAPTPDLEELPKRPKV